MSSLGVPDDAGEPSLPAPARWSDAASGPAPRCKGRDPSGLFPPLTPSSHKGSHGRIAILGGSEKYTGAPYYAAQAALRCGVDLATIFTADEAAIPIKSYSPELMVQSVYSIADLDALANEEEVLLESLEKCRQSDEVMTNEMNELEMEQTMEKLEQSDEKQHILIKNELKSDGRMEALAERLARMKELEEELKHLRDRQEIHVSRAVDAITGMFSSLHALCIGPGLGRQPLVFLVAQKIIRKAIEKNLILVLDADALFMMSLEEYRGLIGELRDYDKCIMTPNLMEMKRLGLPTSNATHGITSTAISKNIIVQKGRIDTIISGSTAMSCLEEGGLKRSGGIGDVLAGTITAFMAWSVITWENSSVDDISIGSQHLRQQRPFACWAACCAVKKATKAAFAKRGRAMSAQDVIGEIGEVIVVMEGELG